MLCPHCGRRSFQMPKTCFRNCGYQLHDVAEKFWFLSLCERQKTRMTTHDVFFRRRKNSLKTAVIARNKLVKIKDPDERFKMVTRIQIYMEHIRLLDEIWNYLNPTKVFFNGFGLHAELVAAARSVRAGTFDDYYQHLGNATK